MNISPVINYKERANNKNINFKAVVCSDISEEFIDYLKCQPPALCAQYAQRLMDAIDFTKKIAPNMGSKNDVIDFNNKTYPSLGGIDVNYNGYYHYTMRPPESYLDDIKYVVGKKWNHIVPTYGKLNLDNEYDSFCKTLSYFEPVQSSKDTVRHILTDGHDIGSKNLNMGIEKIADILNKVRSYLKINQE